MSGNDQLPIHVAAAVIRHHGKFLIAKRASGPLAGKWEFPGGKINSDENAYLAVVREIWEELRLVVKPISILGVFEHTYHFAKIKLQAVECALMLPGGKLPKDDLRDMHSFIESDGSHSETAWISLSDVRKYDLAETDVKVVSAITL